MTDLEFHVICERARIMLDSHSQLSDGEIADRYLFFHHVMISGEDVRRARRAFQDRMRRAKSITLKALDEQD